MIFGARHLAQRRRALVERSAAQRRALAAAAGPLAARAAAADRLVSAIRTSLPWVARGLTLYTLLKGAAPNRRQTNSKAATISAVSAASKP